MLRVKVKENNCFLKTECIICGKVFELGTVIATLWDNEVSLGDVCQDCMYKGKDEFSNGLHEHIDYLKETVGTLRYFIEQIETSNIECPSWPEVEKMREEIEARLPK